MAEFIRKQNRLIRQAYLGRRWYFVTLCTAKRCPLLGNKDLVNMLLEILERVCALHKFEVYAYCFMPNHVHLEFTACSEGCDLSLLMRDFKGISATRARRLGIRGLWQKSFYDHVLREGENEKAVAWYIFNNPVRKGLVQDPLDWTFSGSWVFDWKTLLTRQRGFIANWRPQPGEINPSPRHQGVEAALRRHVV